MTISLPIFHTGPPLLFASSVALVSSHFGGIILLHGAHERDFAADIFIENLIGVEQIVFVILFEDA